MTDRFNFSGIIAPVITPFGDDGAPDAARFIDHCQWLMREGCTALLPFGTTSEATSLGFDERMEMLESLVDAQVAPPSKLMVGTGCCAVADAVVLTRHALDLECGGVLTLPPFYYKSPSDEGVFRYYADVIEGVGDDRLRLYLYHIPGQTMVGLSPALVSKLVEAFPGIVVGLKDSSGDWENMKALLELKLPGFEMFTGSENYLLDAVKLGAAGSINAYANLLPRLQRQLFDNWQSPDAPELQSEVSAFRRTMSAYPMIPAIKGVLAHYRADSRWAYLRPPLEQMDKAQIAAVITDIASHHGFGLSAISMNTPIEV